MTPDQLFPRPAIPLVVSAKGISMLRFLSGFSAILSAHLSRPRSARLSGATGQTTAEYALVLLGAATIAMLVVTWASSSGAIGKLFDVVVSHVIGAVT